HFSLWERCRRNLKWPRFVRRLKLRKLRRIRRSLRRGVTRNQTLVLRVVKILALLDDVQRGLREDLLTTVHRDAIRTTAQHGHVMLSGVPCPRRQPRHGRSRLASDRQ